MRKRNKRTLNSRIKYTTKLCIILVIAIFAATISFMSAYITKQNSSFFAGMFAHVIADRLTSKETLDYLSVDDVVKIKPGSTEANLLFTIMKEFESNAYQYYLLDRQEGVVVSIPKPPPGAAAGAESDLIIHPQEGLGRAKFNDISQVMILIDGNIVYRTDPYTGPARTDVKQDTTFLQEVSDFFTTQSVYYIPNSDGKPVAEVLVRLNPSFSLQFYGYLVIGILFAAIASYIVSLILTSFLTRTVSKPFEILDKNLVYLAEGNYDELLNSHIQVKKPLTEIKSIADSTNIILDKMHEFSHIIGNQNDLMEKQNLELESQNEELMESRKQIRDAQTQLVQNQNLASVGQLTAAISHEINTPLGTINSNVQLQNMILDMLLSNPEITGDSELYETVSQMRRAGSASMASCDQVSLIIKSLKNFSRLDQADYQECDINENARSVVLLTRYLWKNRIAMHEEYGAIPYIKCYPGLLNQVFMNILVNAIRSIPDKGDITIKTWHDEDYVYTSIRDTGKGIRKEKLAGIFESGFTVSEAEKGIGLGLSISKNIIDKHNGSLEVKSKFGEGTEFTFKLPIKGNI
ncbi:MAG: HAMP domain-containing histidine kinase [Clostridia bacterium]|nr:HAMP domain-containing histidine kinase [Clostridia bacterium]